MCVIGTQPESFCVGWVGKIVSGKIKPTPCVFWLRAYSDATVRGGRIGRALVSRAGGRPVRTHGRVKLITIRFLARCLALLG